MKKLLILVAALSLIVFTTACKKEEPVAPATEPTAVEETAADMQEAAQETMDEATAAVEEGAAKVQETAEEAMDAGQEMVEEGQAKMEEAADSAKTMMDDAEQAMDMEMPEKE